MSASGETSFGPARQVMPYTPIDAAPESEISRELVPWLCAAEDPGLHVAVVVAESLRAEGEGPSPAMLTAVPVATLDTCSWHVVGGFLLAELPYDPDLGVVLDEE